MKGYIWCWLIKILLTGVLTLASIHSVCFADETVSFEYDYLLDEVFDDSTVDEVIGQVFEDSRISIKEMVISLLNGESTVIDVLVELVKTRMGSLSHFKNVFLKLVVLTLMCGLYGFLPQIFGGEQSSQMGQFICIIVLLAYLLSFFQDALSIVTDATSIIIFLMNAMLPVYLISLALSGAITTAGIYYGVFQILIYIVQRLIIKIVCPMVLVFSAMGFANQMLEADKFSRLTEMIKKIIGWGLKGVVSLVMGFQFLQSLITPYLDKYSTSITKQTIEVIPGIGDLASSGIEIGVGAALVVKNTLGVAAMLVLTAAVLVPMIELGCYLGVLSIVNALLQSVIQVTVQRILEVAADAIKLLIKVLFCVLLLFMLSIALLAVGAGGGV